MYIVKNPLISSIEWKEYFMQLEKDNRYIREKMARSYDWK